MICSRSFRALMRRNIIYRKRKPIGSCLEILLPVAFVCILLAIKLSLENTDSFKPKQIPPDFPDSRDTLVPFSFTDYVTAIQAKRECTVIGGDFEITGMSNQGYNWQVPFVKCDSRACVEDGEDAQDKYCEYQIFAVAPNTVDNENAKTQATSFTEFVYAQYPQLINNTPFEYDFIRVFESDSAVEDYVKSGDYGKTGYPKVGLAVIFTSGGAKSYDYTIRVNSTNFNALESEGRPASRTTPQTDTLFNSFQKNDDTSCQTQGGTPDLGPWRNSCTGQYIYNGALTIQRLVGDWILNSTGARDSGYFVAEHGVQFVSFPSRAYVENGFYENIADFAPLIVMIGFLYPVAAIIRAITLEKELRQKELMKMMSVNEADIGWSWFCSYAWFHFITVIGCTISSSYLYENSAAAYLFFFWLLTLLSATIVFSIFISSFISKSTRATLIGLLLFFVGYFLTLIVAFDTGSSGVISLISLHPVAAFSFGLQEIGRLEDLGVGVTSSTFNDTDSPSGYTLQNTYFSLIIDCLIWGILSWYLNRVVPSDFGQPLPWYFPFTRSYWCPSNASAPMDNEEEQVGSASVRTSTVLEPVSDALKEQASEGKSIEVRGLRKQYGDKTAVDGLTMSMYSGQITALLGHNGAGKTTTINMLTGMVAPTDGYAIVAGNDIRTQMNQIREEIGICLQHDCLFPLLTVKEHVQFFARIKGLYAKKSHSQAEDAVRTSIEDVALLEKSNTLSSNLSGGMKRKLSVAIAFCGDSKTVLLDEPTSGMDPFSRRFTWNVIRQYRQDRCIILTTHFMDEADILGDRIAIMSQGQLRCLGSSLFLKKHYGVGYQLTIEKQSKSIGTSAHAEVSGIEDEEVTLTSESHLVEEDPPSHSAEPHHVVAGVPSETVDNKLNRIVRGNVKGAKLLSNVGTEISFQLPLDASSSFRPMFDDLDKEVDTGVIVTYGVGITTLDEVFLLVARGETGNRESMRSSLKSSDLVADGNKSHRSRDALQRDGLFAKHVRALFQKRAVNFKRDKKAWCCSTFLPSIFVLIGFILFKYAGVDRNLDSLVLNLEDYNGNVNSKPRNPIPFNNPGEYTCQPGVCIYQDPNPDLSDTTGENYYYCGFSTRTLGEEKCSIANSSDVVSRITTAGAVPEGSDVTAIEESSLSLFNTSNIYEASQYGALYFTHEIGSVTASGQSYGSLVENSCRNATGDYVSQAQCVNYRGLGYVVSYNFTSLHSSLLYQTLADEAIVQDVLDDSEITIKTTIHPLPITRVEDGFGQAEDAFSAWFLVVLSFPFIAGSFATFVVAEKLSKAKHLQTVAGVKPSAYWMSTYLWDILNYQFPLWITVILMFAFGVDSFTTSERGVAGGTITTLILFGPAAAGFTYCTTFAFESPSMCNLFVIISNFIVSMAGPLVAFILRLIGDDPSNPNQTLVDVANAIEWVLRFIPSFCLGNSLFKIINIGSLEFLAREPITVWDESAILYDVVFLGVECVVYIMLTMQIDRWSTNPKAVSTWKSVVQFLTCRCCCGTEIKLDEGITAALPDDEDVRAEADRVINGGASNDLIVVDQMTKQYPNGKLAVNNLSFGIPGGECFGLLGINGAGKTSTMAMLTAEFPPSSGDAILAGYSVTKEPEQTRRRIGYCPQFDALFVNMTGREHVELYAEIKGIPRENVKEAAAAKLREVGLSDFDSDRLSAGYSGGMKRKLSVGCATIGQPEIVFLDEPSTGMDPVARRDLWQVISDMVCATGPEDKTSVILTTHSMEEAEALCPRIGIMASGKLRCLGSAQHLKSRFGQGYQVELKLEDVENQDEDYKEIVDNLLSHVGGAPTEESEDPEEAGRPNTDDIFFSLDEARAAITVLTGDDYLSSLIAADDPTGYVIYKNASSPVGVTLDELASFAAEELRMRHLKVFFEETYPNSLLRERQDNKARFEVGSAGLRISTLFATVEENKESLMLADYGISQTSLEQVFNMHAAEAERLKQGTNDG